MPGDSLQSVVQYLHRIADVGPGAASDADLLDRFATRRDESAFALLVYRHGPLVLGVCQRVLHHEQDSEDVFQATFLTLARKAGSIGKKDALASWLYKVAFRIACRARGKASMLTNQSARLQGQAEAEADVIWRDLRPALDDEIAQLPESYSRPIILCYLEGKTHEEAAKLLGWPKGTVASNLARGRERLRQRLTRRGWTLSAAGLATVLADNACAGAIPAELVRSTVHAALAYVSGTSVAVLSAKAVALAEGVLQMMWYSKVKMAVIVLLAVALTGSGVGWVMHHALAGAEQVEQKAKAEPPGDAKADLAALRAEIAKLRTELEDARREIKSLKAAMPRAAVEREPRYKGKPAQQWLELLDDTDRATRRLAIEPLGALANKKPDLIPIIVQELKDADPLMRGEALAALWPYVKKKKDLIPILGQMLKDSDEQVACNAVFYMKQLGPDGVPLLVECLEGKNPLKVRVWVAEVFGTMESEAKTVLPALTRVLKADLARAAVKDSDWALRRAMIDALGNIGPDAKVAAPVLVATLEDFFKWRKRELGDEPGWELNQYNFGGGALAYSILNALMLMDADLPAILEKRKLTKEEAGFGPRGPGKGPPGARMPEIVVTSWPEVRELLLKRYKQTKP